MESEFNKKENTAMKNMRKTLRNQKGFTLVEMIAVLVIVGILAAVAIPKYMSMQSAAQVNAAQGALAAAASGISLTYASCITGGLTPSALTATGGFTGTGTACTSIAGTTFGDFTVTYPALTWPSVSIQLSTTSPAWLSAVTAASLNKTIILQ